MFANFHRLSAETYKAMELELFTGAAALMAEYNGIEKKAHVREKLTWLVMYTEAVETLGRAAVEHCVNEPGSDLVYPNPMIANICKFYFADNWHHGDQVHPGHRRRHHRHRAVVQGLRQPRDPRPHGEVLRRQRPHARPRTGCAWSSWSAT